MKNIYTPDPKPFYNKYQVLNQDGTPVEGPTFTLRPHDPHARTALLAYANSVASDNPALAFDLRRLVDQYMSEEEHWQIEAEMDAQSELHRLASIGRQATEEFITVHDSLGDEVALIKYEYDDGSPQTYEHPGEPGYEMWRFATCKEVAEYFAVKAEVTE